jgi:hypothetical protein
MMSSKNQVPDNMDNVVAISGLDPWFAKACINYRVNQARLHLGQGTIKVCDCGSVTSFVTCALHAENTTHTVCLD